MNQVIDAHAHVVPRRLATAAQAGETRHGITFDRDETGRITSATGGPPMALPWPTPLQTTAERVESMDARRVDVHLLSITPTMHWYNLAPADGKSLAEETNDDIAEMMAEHPGRFGGLAFLPLQDPAAAIAELERCTTDLGFTGALVGTHVNGKDWDAPQLFEVLEAAVDLDALVFFHPTRGRANPFLPNYHLRNLIGNPLETAIALASLIFGGVLDRLADPKLCFAHGGGYGCLGIARMDHGYEARSEAAGIAQMPSEYVKNLYFDSLVHGYEALDHVIDLVGVDHVVLGSDYPADMGEPFPVDWLGGHPTLTEEDRRKILGENLAALIGWEG
ncbi:MAG: amidohydrolase [Acidimicrobiia bacterium]|nr:amidohydrolase [Acidimicrobiia bacterium]